MQLRTYRVSLAIKILEQGDILSIWIKRVIIMLYVLLMMNYFRSVNHKINVTLFNEMSANRKLYA